jgi:uncharacterized protein with gpF-like domain
MAKPRPPVTMPTADPVHPNVGLQVGYHRKLAALVTAMSHDVVHEVRLAYKAEPPAIQTLDVQAQDASPSSELRKLLRKMARRWQSNFDVLAKEMAEHFAVTAEDRSQRDLMNSLRKAGFALKFKPSKAQRDVFGAVVGQNVALIKSIPQKYLTDVEGAVMRSVMAGRDVGALTQELKATYGVTQRRAAFIARDQTSKATAAFVRVRQQEAGITQALWIHSHGGKEPRPTHLENDGKPYDIAAGWYDPAVEQHIWPGELPNCRCVSRPIIPGWNG